MKSLVGNLVLVVLGGLFFIATGCAVHTVRPVQPGKNIPGKFGSANASGVPVADDQRWWEAFNDPVLNRLVEKGLAHNLTIEQAVARFKQVEAIARKVNATRFPQIDLSASGTRSREPGVFEAAIGNSYVLSAAAHYEVDLWNRLKSTQNARELEAAATLEDLKTVYLTISSQVADFYYLLVEQKAQLSLVERTISTRTRSLRSVETKYRAGLVSPVDLYQARQNLAAARAGRPGVEAQIALAAHALSVLVGEYPDVSIGGKLSELPELPATFPEGLPSDLLANRPDIRGALLMVSAADQEIGAAVAARFPSFNILADFGRSGTDFGKSLSDTVWQLTGNLVMPLLDWGGRKAEVMRNQAVFEERLAAYRHTILTAFREVEDALVQNQADMETIQGLTVEMAAAESTVSLAVERYLDGLSDYLPVLDAQTRHFDAGSRLLAARRALVSSRITLARVLGGSWMVDDIQHRLEMPAPRH